MSAHPRTPVGRQRKTAPFLIVATGKGPFYFLKKTAVLLDLGFLLHKLRPILGNRQATALEVRDFALRCLQTDEELFRIYCYHCLPYARRETHPLTGAVIDFSATSKFKSMSHFVDDFQVVLVTMGHTLVKRELKVHADELRSVVYP